MEYMETATITPGAMSLVLQTARIAGVAPLSFKKLRNCYSISVSRVQLAYSFFVITAFNVIGLIGMFLDLQNKQLLDFNLPSATRLLVAERMTCILACGMGYMAPSRLKNMIYHINILNEIRTNINGGNSSDKEEKNMMWMCCFLTVTYFVFSLFEIMSTTFRVTEWDVGTILLAIHGSQYTILLLLKIQIVVINLEVYKVFLELNARLRCIITLADHEHLTTAESQIIRNEVRRFSQCYVSICDVVAKINNADGVFIFLIYTCCAILTVFNGYRFIVALDHYGTKYNFADMMLQSGWCIMILLRTAFFVEPFQRISGQVAEMKVLLTQLLYHVTPLGHHVTIELGTIIKQVLMTVPQYYPLGLITLNRSLITTTLNVIITCLVCLIQIKL